MMSNQINSHHLAKEAAGKTAAALIETGMIVGLGTGTTAAFFIASLGERCRQGLKIKGVPTSQQTLELALLSEIPLIQPNEVTSIDVTVDGADEADKQKQLIKGGGGALLREKIVASMSREMVVIIDWTKEVEKLGAVPIPIEITPFAYEATIKKINGIGLKGSLRMSKNGQPYLTENSNYLYDIVLSDLCDDPEILHQKIKMVIGVVETGLFLNMATHIIVGYADGHVEIQR